jgi:hypothetical protein
MLIPFRGYAVDSTIAGELESEFDRVKDIIDRVEAVEVHDATLQSLDDGSELCVPLLRLDRDDLMAVEAVERRGRSARRIMTTATGARRCPASRAGSMIPPALRSAPAR